MSDRLLHADFVRIVASHTLAALGWSSMLLLPVYLAHVGASRAEIGAIMSASAMAGLLVRPAVGVLLDRWGRRPVIAIGATVQAIAMGAVAGIEAPDAFAFGVRSLFGLGTAAVFTGYFTLATDLVPTRRRTEGIALFGISGLVPLSINPLSQTIGIDAPALRWFLPATGVLVLLSVWPLAGIRERPRTTGKGPGGLAVLRALGRRPLWSAWVATLAFATLVVVFQAFATVTAHARGIPRPADIWLSYAIGAVAVRLFGARLPDRVGPHNLIAPAMAALAGGILALAVAADREAVLLAGLLGGLGHGIGFPVLTSQVASRSPESMRGSALAGFTGLWDCSFLIAPPLLGRIADRDGDAAMLTTAATLAVFALAAWMALEARFGGASRELDAEA